MRDARQACEAVEEMQKLGAAAAVVYGTVGNRMLSHSSFTPVWDEFARSGLPLCVHMGSSYAALAELCENILDSNMISKALPANLAFVAIVGHGMLDRYPESESRLSRIRRRMDLLHGGRLEALRRRSTNGACRSSKGLLARDVDDYFKSGHIFVAAEADDAMMTQEMACSAKIKFFSRRTFPTTRVAATR